MNKVRESNYELLRIIAMLFIVIYHILHFYVIPFSDSSLLKAICIPLHQGVILFVLISGYYGIRLSINKIVKFVFPVLFYYILLSLFEVIIYGGGYLTVFLFISRSPYWFVRSYLWLLLTSPIMNIFLRSTEKRRCLLMVSILGIISIWMGITGGDPSIDGGKNLLHFYFLYGLGYSIRRNQSLIDVIPVKLLIVFYVAFNLLIILFFTTLLGHFVYSEVLYDWCFKYNSLVLVIDSCILFILFGKLRLCSSLVNAVAASCFSVYLISEHHLIHRLIIAPIVKCYYDPSHLSMVFSETIVFALFLFLVCVSVDRLLLSRITVKICNLFPTASFE